MLDTILDLLQGRLSSEARVWSALAPAILASAYFLGGLAVYSLRYLVRGPHRDAEIENRGSTVAMGMFLRLFFVWLMKPVWSVIYRTGLPANAITTLSLLLATASGVSLAAGRFALGGWLYIIAGICDFLDGRIARARGSVSRSGAALDSVLDRYSDSAVLVGLSWYYRDSWVLLAAQAALVGSSLVPYIRARGEAAGIVVKDVGFMQRAERIMYLGAAVALSPIVEVWLAPAEARPLHRLAVVGVVLLAVSTQVTALQRLVYLLGALKEEVSESRWLGVGKGSLFRNAAAAFVATGADFVLVFGLVAHALMAAPLATAFGCLLGALVNFTLNRVWAFGGAGGRKLPQLGRYAFVSFTSALLNSGGVAVLLMLPSIDYRLAWILVRTAVFVAWNFPLQREYVFKTPDTASGSGSPA